MSGQFSPELVAIREQQKQMQVINGLEIIKTDVQQADIALRIQKIHTDERKAAVGGGGAETKKEDCKKQEKNDDKRFREVYFCAEC